MFIQKYKYFVLKNFMVTKRQIIIKVIFEIVCLILNCIFQSDMSYINFRPIGVRRIFLIKRNSFRPIMIKYFIFQTNHISYQFLV